MVMPQFNPMGGQMDLNQNPGMMMDQNMMQFQIQQQL
jgi:hypothetical protein